jgi:hypothetical protein
VATTNTAVFGIYKTTAQAESAIDQIVEFRTVAGGFTHNDISVLLPDIKSSKDYAYEKNVQAPEGTATGVTTGGAIDGILGLLARNGALAAVGGLVPTLVGMGVPEYEANRYEARVQDGGVLLSVHCDASDQVSRAMDLLKQTGAEDVSSASEQAVSSDEVGT